MPPKFSLVEKNVVGAVKWFNAKEQCGRITIENYGDVYVHASRIKEGRALKSRQHVRCNVLKGPKGLQAAAVEVVDLSVRLSRSDVTNAPKSRQRNSSADSACSSTTADSVCPPDDITAIESDLRGEVVSYNRERGFGFILVRQYGSIFCHVSHIDFAGLNAREKYLEPTQFVKCDVGRDRKGKLMALKVHVICELAKPDAECGATVVEAKATSKKTRRGNPKKTTEEEESSDDKNQGGILAGDLLGEVVAWKPKQRFGFIKVQGYDTVFVHHNGLMGVTSLQAKQVVKCDITKGPKTYMAINVRVIGDCSLPQAPASPQPSAHLPPQQPPQPPQMRPLASAPPPNFQPGPFACAPPPLMNPQYPYHHDMPAPGYGYGYGHGPMPMQPPSYPAPGGLMERPPPYQEFMKMQLTEQVSASTRAANMIDEKMRSKKKKKESSPEEPKKSGPPSATLKCGICEDILDDPVTTPCEHLFCRECIDEWLAFNPSCPVDGRAVSRKAVKPAPQYVQNLLKN